MKLSIPFLFAVSFATGFARGQDLLRHYPGLGTSEVLQDLDGDGARDLAALTGVGFPGPTYWAVQFASGATGAPLATAVTSVGYFNYWWAPQLARIGDIDGDGIDDVAFAINGRAELYSSATASLVRVLVSPGATTTSYPTSITALGDIDGDGVRDIALGLARNRVLYNSFFFIWFAVLDGPGRIDLFSGANGALIRTIVESPTPPLNGTGFGARVASLGDWNGDGIDDVLVSNCLEPWGSWRGYVAGISGATGVELFRVFVATAPGYGAHSDGEIAALGDVDGDNVPDFAVAEPSWKRVRVYSGASLSVRSTTNGGPHARDYATNLRALRDFDGDGVRDFGVAMPQYEPTISEGLVLPPDVDPCGWAQIVSGATGEALWTRVGFANQEHLGRDLELIDDLDGDGRPEVITNAFDPATQPFVDGLGVFSSRSVYSEPTSYCAGLARLSWSGTTSVAADDFTLELGRARPGWIANFHAAVSATGGWLAITPCIQGFGMRLGPAVAIDAYGHATRALHPVSSAVLAAGTTWYFQAVQSASSQQAEFSNGLAVTFTP